MKRTDSRQERNDRIMLGLAVSSLSMAPGQRRTADEIAAFCGCRKYAIQRTEKLALQKLRHALVEEQ